MDYKAGYSYVLHKDEVFKTNIIGYSFQTNFFSLTLVGILTIKAWYAWNGANCFPDIPSVMRGSLAHDCGYQMINEGLLPMSEKPYIDQLLFDCCFVDGMPGFMANAVLEGVETFGAYYADPSRQNPVLTAP